MKKIIITLTSYPARIEYVNKTITSLIEQTQPADKILLWLSKEEFNNKDIELPEELLSIVGKFGFEIRWVEGNLKSHKKYYYALQEYTEDIVITVDDDIEYAKTLISDLYNSYLNFPNAVSARRARIILRSALELECYNEWESYPDKFAHQPRMDICAIGVGGVLYPPNCASKKWFVQKNILQLAENQDDLWLKYNEIIDNIPVVYVKPKEKDILIEYSEDTSLSKDNVSNGKNDLCIFKLNNYLKNYRKLIFEEWFNNLISKENYILQKKEFYYSKIRELILNMKEEPIYLYGAGKRAEKIMKILNECNMAESLDAIIVSDKESNPEYFHQKKVIEISQIDKFKKINVIYGVNILNQLEILKKLKEYNCECFNLDIDPIIKYYI